MSKGIAWIFNILILIGLIILFLAIGSFIPPFFAIFGILFLAAGIYIGFKSTGTSRKEEILDSQEIPIVNNLNISNEVSENSNNSIRQSNTLAIDIEKEEIKPEVIVMPEESVELKKETENPMKRKQKAWYFRPLKPPKQKVPEDIKIEVETKAKELIDSFLKPTYIKPPSKDNQFSYIVDIYAKWYRSYFHFIAKYRCPAPNCISEFFESKFARMEYIGNSLFNFSYMRYTEQWLELFTDFSIDECLETIKNDPHFMP